MDSKKDQLPPRTSETRSAKESRDCGGMDETPKSATPPASVNGNGNGCGCGADRPLKRILVIAAIAVGLILVYTALGGNRSTCCGSPVQSEPVATPPPDASASVPVSAATAAAAKPPAGVGLPKLLDLGADKCIPCKKMAPLLAELKTTYAGKLDVLFIDVWKIPAEAEEYSIETIPTQIFFNAQGKELFRHEGFFAKDDILAKWKELGIDLNISGTPK